MNVQNFFELGKPDVIPLPKISHQTGDQAFTPARQVSVDDIYTVSAHYGYNAKALFMVDRVTGIRYPFAVGEGVAWRDFDVLDAQLLPPDLQLPKQFEDMSPSMRDKFIWDIKPVDIIPETYRGCRKNELKGSAQFDNALQATAIAILLGDDRIRNLAFNLSGDFYALPLSGAELFALRDVATHKIGEDQLPNMERLTRTSYKGVYKAFPQKTGLRVGFYPRNYWAGDGR